MSTRTYTATLEREDDLSITVSITASAGRRDVNELGELAQMGSLRVNGLLDSHNEFVARMDAREAAEDAAEPAPSAVPPVHAVMYRDHRMGTLCDSGAWGTPSLFTAVTEDVTCPGCRAKLDGGPVPRPDDEPPF